MDEHPLDGVSYYRIKATDLSTQDAYSSVVKVSNNNRQESSVSIYPNPVTAKRLGVQYNNIPTGEYRLHLFTTDGKQVWQQAMQHNGVNATYTFQISQGITSGTYLLLIEGVNGSWKKVILVK